MTSLFGMMSPELWSPFSASLGRFLECGDGAVSDSSSPELVSQPIIIAQHHGSAYLAGGESCIRHANPSPHPLPPPPVPVVSCRDGSREPCNVLLFAVPVSGAHRPCFIGGMLCNQTECAANSEHD